MTIPTFPVLKGCAYPLHRSPIWKTIKQDSWSGKSSTVQVWTYPRRRYTLTYGRLRSAAAYTELQQLEGFYNSLGGSAGMFLFTDPDDNAIAASNFGTGDGVTSTFQLLRPWGGSLEPVFFPRAGFAVSVAGQATNGFTTGSNPGQLVFSTPPANGAALTWTGSYDWPCRFDDDNLDFTKFIGGNFSLSSFSFTTVKL